MTPTGFGQRKRRAIAQGLPWLSRSRITTIAELTGLFDKFPFKKLSAQIEQFPSISRVVWQRSRRLAPASPTQLQAQKSWRPGNSPGNRPQRCRSTRLRFSVRPFNYRCLIRRNRRLVYSGRSKFPSSPSD